MRFISNFKKAKDNLEYISDFLQIAHDVFNSKQAISEGKSKIYTIDELKTLLIAW